MTARRSPPSSNGPAAKHSLVVRVRQQAHQVAADLLGLLFPSRCAGCGRVDEVLCPTCRASFATLIAPLCARCGRPVEGAEDLCVDCQVQAPLFSEGCSVFRFEGALRQAVHALKYKGRAEIAPMLAEEMFKAIESHFPQCEAWPLDVAIAIPLHPVREGQRGYNQSQLLVDGLAALWEVPVDDRLAWRVRDTRSQLGLNLLERRENVKSAFRADAAASGADVLLVDDVRTTGATLAACTDALLEAGARSVRVLTLAQAV